VKTDSAIPHVDENGVPTHFTGQFGSGDGGFTFIAANGDKLGCHYGRAVGSCTRSPNRSYSGPAIPLATPGKAKAS